MSWACLAPSLFPSFDWIKKSSQGNTRELKQKDKVVIDPETQCMSMILIYMWHRSREPLIAFHCHALTLFCDLFFFSLPHLLSFLLVFLASLLLVVYHEQAKPFAWTKRGEKHTRQENKREVDLEARDQHRWSSLFFHSYPLLCWWRWWLLTV